MAQKPLSNRFRTLTGFTLVELLVVVAIVSVLIALLMPALSKVREHANRVKCAANLRSIGQALTMYTQQYGYYPGGGMWPAGLGSSSNVCAIWPVRLRPFTGGDQRVFHCPARDERFEWKKDDASRATAGRATAAHAAFGYEEGEPLLVWDSGTFSYGYNIWGTGGPGLPSARQLGLADSIVRKEAVSPRDWDAHREIRATRVKLPSEMIAIADSSADGRWDFAIVAYAAYGAPPYKPINPEGVHGGGANVLFCDGHVQWYLRNDLLTTGDFFDLADRARRRMWNNDHEEHS